MGSLSSTALRPEATNSSAMAVATLSLASCVAVRRTRSTVRPTRTMATRASFVPFIARAPKVALKPQLRSANVSAIRAAAPRVNVARRTIVTKAAEAAVATEGKKSNTLQLGLYFAGWYAFNIYFNIYNKQVLKVFPFPWTCTLIQFFGGIIVSALLWGSTLVKAPKFGEVEVPEVASDSTPEAIAAAKKAEEEDNKLVSVKQLYMILPLALVHTLGNLLTNVSLGKVAVSFTHTIKAMEPFFSVLLSSIFLGDAPSMLVIGSLLPIVGGVALASVSEVSFNWVGFLAAMGSNITFQSRNVLSKKLMTGKAKKGLNQINLFSIITCMSFFLLLPFTLAVEGFQVAGPFMTSEIARRLCYSSLCFHSYQLVSYLILGLVSPVTHSVGNCVKRVVVIIASVIFFQSPVSPMNAVGTAIALAGVFAYSQVKRLEGKKKA